MLDLDRTGSPTFTNTIRPLRVSHVVISMDVGGLERNVVNQVREANRVGQCVDVICLERPGVLASQVEELGGRVTSLDKPPGLKLGLIEKLRREFRRNRPDVVHTHQVAGLFYAATAAVIAGVPLIVHTEHGKHYAGHRKSAWLGRLGAAHVERFYCLSNDMAAEAIDARVVPRRKVRVINNGIDLVRFREAGDPLALRASLGIPPDAPVIGTAGRLNEVKCQDVLIRGFARLRSRVPAAHLVLLGEGDLRDELIRLSESLGVADAVHFAGYSTEPQHYHHMFDVFALTSRAEGTPQAVIESSVAVRPVIASRVGGVPELIEHGQTGLLFDSGDDEALADGLYRLVTNRPFARRLAESGRDRVEERYDIRRMVDDYHRDYVELLSRHRPRR